MLRVCAEGIALTTICASRREFSRSEEALMQGGTGMPGRYFLFSRSRSMESAREDARTQRRIRVCGGCWRARQQDRCPSCRRREWRCGSSWASFGFAKGKFRFLAVHEALQVSVVLENDHARGEEGAEVDHQWWRVTGGPQEIHQQGHHGSGGDGTEGNVA